MTGLRSFPEGTFLHYLPPAVRERLLALGAEARYAAGQVLMRQGEASTPIFVLLEGVAKVSARPGGGHESLLAVRVAGDVVGDMVPLTHSLHAATVTTCGAVRASVVSGPAFLDFVRGSAPAGLAMSRFIVDRLRWAEQSRLDLAGYDTGACLARLLLSLAGRHGRHGTRGLDVGVPLSGPELAALAGADPDLTAKALRDLRRRRLIRPVDGRIEILDVTALATLADFRAF
ncbi:Crp/Fnr family transcriptional regulator [Nonomuraea sp. ATR24]|uniref:Crp/Fnr family transcriptional regulator n=1 Tax=unclassified Nonomuraea TaxID=2593643 RepID=UPI0033C7B948